MCALASKDHQRLVSDALLGTALGLMPVGEGWGGGHEDTFS